ncbi:MAG: hypothetical protein ACRDAM_15975 [Casimicrobium sp.]
MSTPEVYLITAIHADGSRRQWAGPQPRIHFQMVGSICIGKYEEIDDPHRKIETRYEYQPLHTLPDCPTKNKTLTQ